MYLVSVSKKYSNYNGRVKFRLKPKTQHTAYFVDENDKIHTKKLSKSKYFIYKFLKKKWKKRKFLCTECQNTFFALIKKTGDKVTCPHC